jgi:hypothetical protein
MVKTRDIAEDASRITGVLGFGLAVNPHWPAPLLLIVIACTFNPTLGLMIRLTFACTAGVVASVICGDASFGIGCALIAVAIAVTVAVQLSDRLETAQKAPATYGSEPSSEDIPPRTKMDIIDFAF